MTTSQEKPKQGRGHKKCTGVSFQLRIEGMLCRQFCQLFKLRLVSACSAASSP